MNYTETLDYLYKKLPLFSRLGSAAYKKDLANIDVLCRFLGNPHQQFKSVHIAGTNGKGSVSHMLAAVLQTAGYQTGLYTSPHIKDFRERIRINGTMVAEDYVIRFVEKIKPLIDQIEPSFFEITVAMAFDLFAQEKVDLAVVEVGLGGRLDSTNIIKPEVCVITNIGLDHTDLLGTTLEEIAAEKGGIIKQGTPVVVGEKNEKTMPVFEKIAREKKADLYFAEDHFSVEDHQLKDHLHLRILDKHTNNDAFYELDLPGIYQTKNILTVLQTIAVLQKAGWKIGQEEMRSALKQVKKITGLSGRWEVIHRQPTIVLEVAHNEDGIRQMMEHLRRLSFERLHIVFGMVKDKDADKILSLFPAQATYYFTQAAIPRALDAHALKEKASRLFLQGNVFENVNEALEEAVRSASPNDLIVVCGSIFLVAEVKKETFGL